MFVLFAIIAVFPGLMGVLAARHAPFRAALLASWGTLTTLGFAPAGLFFAVGTLARSASHDPFMAVAAALFSVLAMVVALQGFVVGVSLLVRVARLSRNEPEGSATFLLLHHAAVFVVFTVLDLIHGMDGGLALFCAIACGIGALISMPRPLSTPLVRPVAF